MSPSYNNTRRYIPPRIPPQFELPSQQAARMARQYEQRADNEISRSMDDECYRAGDAIALALLAVAAEIRALRYQLAESGLS